MGGCPQNTRFELSQAGGVLAATLNWGQVPGVSGGSQEGGNQANPLLLSVATQAPPPLPWPRGCSFNAPTPIYNLKQSEKLPWAGFVIKCQAELNRWPRHWLNALETPPGTGHILDPLWKLITYWQSRTTVLTLTVNLQLRVTGNSIRNSCGLL